MPKPADQTPILERIKSIIPPAGAIARALKVEHATAERIHRLMLVSHAELVELAEEASVTTATLIEISDQAAKVATDAIDLRMSADAAAIVGVIVFSLSALLAAALWWK